jgi:hypothetical protein
MFEDTDFDSVLNILTERGPDFGTAIDEGGGPHCSLCQLRGHPFCLYQQT